MRLSAVAASDRRTEVYRITDGGDLQCRSLESAKSEEGWSAWERAPFEPEAVGVAAISGWPEQIEVFVIDRAGVVWNRWWWSGRGWAPQDGFNSLGTPFANEDIRGFSALGAGAGHFNVFVEARDGRVAVLPHVDSAQGPVWRRCEGPDALSDGWWPAFGPASSEVYRVAATVRAG